MNILYSKNKNEIKSPYCLFLDDDENRIPQKLSWIELPWAIWVIVRNYNEFVECISKYGIPMMVSFDHDLAEQHYQEYHRANETDKTINYNNTKEKTGYHAAQFLAEYCISNKLKLPEYFIHSMNYMGKLNIKSVMESAQKIIDNNP